MNEETLAKKAAMLKSLGTKAIVTSLHGYEDQLENTLRDEAKFKSENTGFLASQGSDCSEVKKLLAVLSAQAPTVAGTEKKMTAADRDAWLQTQRTDNPELAAAIARQNDVAFRLEDLRITSEMAKKRLEGCLKVLALKTAQIQFLTGE